MSEKIKNYYKGDVISSQTIATTVHDTTVDIDVKVNWISQAYLILPVGEYHHTTLGRFTDLSLMWEDRTYYSRAVIKDLPISDYVEVCHELRDWFRCAIRTIKAEIGRRDAIKADIDKLLRF